MAPLTATRAISQVKRRPNLSIISDWSIRKLQLKHTWKWIFIKKKLWMLIIPDTWLLHLYSTCIIILKTIFLKSALIFSTFSLRGFIATYFNFAFEYIHSAKLHTKNETCASLMCVELNLCVKPPMIWEGPGFDGLKNWIGTVSILSSNWLGIQKYFIKNEESRNIHQRGKNMSE